MLAVPTRDVGGRNDPKAFRRMDSACTATTCSSYGYSEHSFSSNNNLIKNQNGDSLKGVSSANSIELISPEDITIDRCLGSGAFASVYTIGSIAIAESNNKNDVESDTLTMMATFDRSKFKRYALKCLNVDTLRCSKKTKTAAEDLLTEVKLLSSIPPHKNVIQLHAISDNFYESPEHGFFIVNRLTDTLSDRLKKWRKRVQNQRTNIPGDMKTPTDHQLAVQQSLEEGKQQQYRSEHIGIGLARALQFLHEHDILYRDLKPDNIGFDYHDNIKLFDFGLSKKVDSNNNNVDEDDEPKKQHTQFVGTPRYMATEVATSTTYDFSADVYSYSVLLWEILTLQKPYGQPKSLAHLVKMVAKGVRPSLQLVSSRDMKCLLTDGWDQQPPIRPTMFEVVNDLEEIAQQHIVPNVTLPQQPPQPVHQKHQDHARSKPSSGRASAA